MAKRRKKIDVLSVKFNVELWALMQCFTLSSFPLQTLTIFVTFNDQLKDVHNSTWHSQTGKLTWTIKKRRMKAQPNTSTVVSSLSGTTNRNKMFWKGLCPQRILLLRDSHIMFSAISLLRLGIFQILFAWFYLFLTIRCWYGWAFSQRSARKDFRKIMFWINLQATDS